MVSLHSELMQVRVQHAAHHAGDQNAGPNRQPEQQVQRRRRADDLCQICCGNGDLQRQAEAEVSLRMSAVCSVRQKLQLTKLQETGGHGAGSDAGWLQRHL